MRSLTITWTPRHHGWAVVKVSDDQGEAEMSASRISDGPEQFLYAVARLVLGDQDSRAEMSFPRTELEALRTLMRRYLKTPSAPGITK